jgi:hypothetical protein
VTVLNKFVKVGGLWDVNCKIKRISKLPSRRLGEEIIEEHFIGLTGAFQDKHAVIPARGFAQTGTSTVSARFRGKVIGKRDNMTNWRMVSAVGARKHARNTTLGLGVRRASSAHDTA